MAHSLVNQAVRSIKLTFNIIFSFLSFLTFLSPLGGGGGGGGGEKRMLKMMERNNNDKGESIDRTARFSHSLLCL